MNKDEIFEKYGRGLSGHDANRVQYLRFAKEFLDFSGDRLDRETVNRYMNHLVKTRHYSDGTVNFIFRVIRTMFQRSNIEWPFNRGEAPQIRENKIKAPALHPEVIAEMITHIREKGEPEEQAFLALSTIYGLRRVELVQMEGEDIKIKDRVVHVATAKHGRERTHMMPDEIVPYLKGYDFDTKRSDFGLVTIWHRIEYQIGMKHTDQVGWHSPRRTLNTLLLDYLPDTVVSSFMRWKQRTSSSMPYRYSAQTYVGKEGETTKVVGASLEVDKKVFGKDRATDEEIHPFLKYWR